VKDNFSKIIILLVLLATYLIWIKLTPFQSYASSAWLSTNQLPYPLASHTSFIHQNKIYTINGSAQFMSSRHSVLSNIPLLNGSLASWGTENADTPSALIWHTTTLKDSFVYTLGGKEENIGSAMSHVNKVRLGIIENGVINSWIETTPLPLALSLGAALSTNNKLYYAGGIKIGNAYNQKVYMSEINSSDGTIGSWAEAGNLPAPLSGFGMFTDGNHIIIVGGENANGKSQKTYTTTLNIDGTIGSWQETAALPKALSRAQFTKSGSTLFVIGGINSNGTTSDDLYYTKIKPDGTLEPWKTSLQKIPQPTCCGTAVVLNNYIYLIGGHDTTTTEYFDDVYYSHLNNIIQTVPIFKQGIAPFTNNDPLWETDIFDHATNQFTCGNKMWQCGCSTTSMAMVLKHHGIQKLPDGSALDPGSLNTWLKNTPGGYFRDSGINWAVAATLGKKAKSQNPSFIYNTLEYLPVREENTALLTQDLNNGNPPIIDVTGHFVVGTSNLENSFSINDPFYERFTMESYNNDFAGLRRFIPHSSDSSYIVMAVDKHAQLYLMNSSNQSLVESFVQPHVKNPLANSSITASSLRLIEYPKPESGNYIAEIINDDSLKTYQVDIYALTMDGDIKTDSLSGIMMNNESENILLNFDNQSTSNIDIQKNVTYSTVLNDISELRILNLITKDNVSNHLIRLIEQAQKNEAMDRNRSLQKRFDLFIKLIDREKGNIISDEAYQILMDDISSLHANSN